MGRLILIVVVCGLSACTPSMVLSPQLPISVDGPLEAPRVTFHPDFLGAPCIGGFGIFDQEADEVVWGFSTEPGSGTCHKIPQLTYGQTPDGYSTTTPPQPLRAGTPYVIAGGGDVTYGGKLYMFEDGQWRRLR